MDYSDIRIPQGLYRSQLPKWFAVCFSVAAVLALPGVILLFNREYQSFLIQDIYLSGIIEASAANTWHFIESLVTVVHFLSCAALACSLVLALTSKFHLGIHFLSAAAKWLLSIGIGEHVVSVAVPLHYCQRSMKGHVENKV